MAAGQIDTHKEDAPLVTPADPKFEDGTLEYRMGPLPYKASGVLQEDSEGEPVWDAKVHLKLGMPESVALRDFTTSRNGEAPPPASNNHPPNFAFSSALSVLSPEGVSAFRNVLDRHSPTMSKSLKRSAQYVRNLAYVSKFIRDANEAPELCEHVSRIAGVPLIPHYMHSNYTHTNISIMSEGDSGKIVDSWHVDSVSTVLVVVLSDMEDMEGGIFQAIKKIGKDAAYDAIDKTGNKIPESDVLSVSYAAQGHGILMHGCDVMHRVTPVLRGKESRISIVFSFMHANPFVVDRTIPNTYLPINKEETGEDDDSNMEWARGRSWRAMHQLKYVVEEMEFTKNRPKLKYAADILSADTTCRVGYWNEELKKVCHYDDEWKEMAAEQEKKRQRR